MEKKNLVMVCLCAAIAIMAVAYAAFTTTIEVEGTVNNDSNFSVVFSNPTCVGTPAASNSPMPEGTATANGTTVTFSKLNLYTPGDVVNCDVTVTNNGNLAAKYQSYSITDGITATSSPVAFAVITEPTDLQVGGTSTIKLRFTYDSNIKEQPKDTEYAFKATFNYTQLAK